MSNCNISAIASSAIWAAKRKKLYGRYSTIRFCINHSIPLGLYRLAQQLEVTIKFHKES